jgi:hypothetical protein
MGKINAGKNQGKKNMIQSKGHDPVKKQCFMIGE